MDIKNKTILMVAQYAAPYEGNFVKSLYAIEEKLSNIGCNVSYIWPRDARNKEWFKKAFSSHKFFVVNDNPQKAVDDIGRILIELHPDIIHTHFDGYDVPVIKALRKLGMENDVHVVWHLHDHLGFMNDIARKFYQLYGYLMHYGRYAKNVSAIGVGAEVAYFANTWHKLWCGNGFKKIEVIPNAIDTNRISILKQNDKPGNSFLAFGGRNVQKRIDLLLDAASYINGGGKSKFVNVYITRGTDTDDIVMSKFGNNVPEWCHIVEQRENINELFDMADCFVSCSDAETFSYAVCEATIANMPVIQSDIDGTMWNADNPSTFLFKRGRVESLVVAMQRYMDTDSQTLQKKCLLTRQNNTEKFGIDKWSERIIHFYEQL